MVYLEWMGKKVRTRRYKIKIMKVERKKYAHITYLFEKSYTREMHGLMHVEIELSGFNGWSSGFLISLEIYLLLIHRHGPHVIKHHLHWFQQNSISNILVEMNKWTETVNKIKAITSKHYAYLLVVHQQ